MSLKQRLARGGGWPAIWYALRVARRSGGIIKFLRAMGSRNACKTCALGMGGQPGGMTDEAGKFPEVCKKSMQAMAADMQGGIEPAFFARYGFDELREFTPRDLEHMGRLVRPVYAGPGDDHYQSISWEKALENAASCLRDAAPNEAFFYASGRASNEAAFLMQLFARVHGTNNVNNCSYYCHQASGVGLSSSLGTGTATVVLEDLDRCDTLFLIGGNPASNHPRLMRSLVKLRRRGGNVIVVNPIRETGLVNFAVPSDLRSLMFGSPIASLYVQPHIGGDIAFFCGVAKATEELKAVDEAFVHGCTENAAAFRESIRSLTWKDIEQESGVSRGVIEQVARAYAASERTIFAWTMGITHHVHGVDNVRAIVNLALLRGMVGKPGAGLLPIRGHSNVQGVGSMGVTPKLSPKVVLAMESYFGVRFPTSAGLDTLACLEAMLDGRLRTGWCLGGNLFGASPDAKRTREAFEKLESVVYFSTTLNTGHVHGRARETLILPVLARDEEPQATTQESMFSYVRLSEGGPARHEGPRSEASLVAEIAVRVLGANSPVDWTALADHATIRRAIGAIIPGYQEAGRIDETRREFQVGGRTIHTPRFATPSGKARFHVVMLPGLSESKSNFSGSSLPVDIVDLAGEGPRTRTPFGLAERSPPYAAPEGYVSPAPLSTVEGNGLRLMTIRSEGQFNTVVYEDEDVYRHQDRRDVILLNSADIERLGLRVDQRVTVASAAGRLGGILVREFDIRAGNAAMYFPEANVLVPPVADAESRTPAFKSVSISIAPDHGSGARVQLSISSKPIASPRKLNAC